MRMLLTASVLLAIFAARAAAWQTANPGTPAGAATQPAKVVLPRGFFEIVFSGGVIGDTIMWMLFALSVTAGYLMIEHLLTVRRQQLLPPGLADQVRAFLTGGKLSEATDACNSRPSLLAFVLLHGLSEVEGGWSEVEKAMEEALAEQSARLFRRIEYLTVIGNIGPMLGLLGTVTGMISAFYQVASTQGSAGAADLAQGIYEALVTTVGGLVIAIPSLGAFAIFRNRVDQFIAEAAYQAQHASSPLKRRGTRGDPVPAQPPPVEPPKIESPRAASSKVEAKIESPSKPPRGTR